MIKPAITQKLYNLFPSMHFPSTTADIGESSCPLVQNWASDILTNQLQKCSIASFPEDIPSQPETQISVNTGPAPRPWSSVDPPSKPITEGLAPRHEQQHISTTNQGPVRPNVQYRSLPPTTVITRQPRCNMAFFSAVLLNNGAHKVYPDASEDNGCTFQNILLEQIYNLLPPIPSVSQGNHLSLQCGCIP